MIMHFICKLLSSINYEMGGGEGGRGKESELGIFNLSSQMHKWQDSSWLDACFAPRLKPNFCCHKEVIQCRISSNQSSIYGLKLYSTGIEMIISVMIQSRSCLIGISRK